MEQNKNKQVIGLYGEMCLAMELHERGWQVHRAYLDEGIDFVITQYFCKKCNKFSQQYIKEGKFNNKKAKCVTNLCNICKKTLIIISRNIQVKTSEGIKRNNKDTSTKLFSFHPKIRYNLGDNVFYIWIAVINRKENNIHYYIFNTKEVSKFDNIDLPTYQITDNQKTTLTINEQGEVLNKGTLHDYKCFKDFHNNFDVLLHKNKNEVQ